MSPSILALQPHPLAPLAGLRSVPKIHLARVELFEDPGYLQRAPRQIVEPRQCLNIHLTAESGPFEVR